MSYTPTLINITVSSAQAIDSTPYPNLYGMLIHANPNNEVDVQVLFNEAGPAFYTLKPGDSIQLRPAWAHNTGLVFVQAGDQATPSAVEVIV